MTAYRTTVPSVGETKALMAAMDEKAESFLVACVHFAQFFQTEVEFGTGHDILVGMTEEMYKRRDYYAGRLIAHSGRLHDKKDAVPPTANNPPEGRYSGGFRL